MIAGIAVIKKTFAELKKASLKLFQGEITISKKECWLIGIILVLTGIAFGLINAPLTHGVNINIASHNGCNNGNGSANNSDADVLCKPPFGKKEKPGEKDETKENQNNPKNQKCRRQRRRRRKEAGSLQAE